ncbi:MAG: UDP-N-acetylmuramoyl-L-alanyl-D-glutamate--2,6-diaminopimelate ligase [Candidatus Cloacimonetes bacterium]|nr:UDP-N-acetylmuramoyl-L-alanyl-D-glutamate--2,6-diaminopimelate ligase [Candidatus Cloacimonadota bacterium]
MYSKSKLISYRQILSELTKANLFCRSYYADESAHFSKIETDSRLIGKNNVFICIKGFETDGHLFAKKSKEKGAALFIVQEKLSDDYPQILVKNSRKAAAILAKIYFGDPSAKFKLIGITGTNGKTTIAALIEQILRKNGKRTGLIGTYGYSINGNVHPTGMTTPDIIALNTILSEMEKENVEFVIMEASSHALALDRVYGLHFDAALFTNLTQDHLNFHKNFDDYAKTKFKLFDYLTQNSGSAFINTDDKYGKILFEKLKINKFSISFDDADISIRNCKYELSGTAFELLINNEKIDIKSKLIGNFNAFNMASAISIIKNIAPDIRNSRIRETIINIDQIKGRMEQIQIKKNISVFIDYAHSPDALKNVLQTLSGLKNRNRLICVFGAGGNRDKEKRPLMLIESLKYSDLSIITNDNPRKEEPAGIIRDIVGNYPVEDNFWIIKDRETAIQTAICLAKENDIVLIAGKGHETYQEINGKRFHFDDKEIVLSSSEHPAFAKDELSIPIDPLQLEFIFGDKIDHHTLIKHISTDSRSIKQGALFFALKGENFDGHDYVEQVLEKNCPAVVNNDFQGKSKNLIRVQDTQKAFGKLASKYKSLFDLTSIAITGSYGKTTTKEYLYNILEYHAPTHKTFSNENNLIGLPKTIFHLRPEHKYAIFELGSNQFGEIAELTNICDPDVGIITAIGPSHLEFLIDIDGVFKEKSALLEHKLNIRLFPGDERRFNEFDGITFGYGHPNKYRLSKIESYAKKTEFFVNEQPFSIPTPFKEYSLNALIAVAAAKELGIPDEKIHKGLNDPLNISHRMEILQSGNRTLLIDCYNANPDSMKAAVTFWMDMKKEKPHIAVLGDMLELGSDSKEFHREIKKLLSSKNNMKIISVGDDSRYYGADVHFDNVRDLISSDEIEKLEKDAVILIKASHGIQLEKIIGRL